MSGSGSQHWQMIVAEARKGRAVSASDADAALSALPAARRIEALLDVLGDERLWVRELGIELAAPRIQSDDTLGSAVLALLSDDEHASAGAQQAALLALRSYGGQHASRREEYWQAVVRLCDAPNADVRYQALVVRESHEDTGESYVQTLRRALEDDDEDVRIVAAQGLARLGDRDAIPALEAARSTASYETRFHLLLALVALGAPGLRPKLEAALRDGSHVFAAIEALGRYGDKDAAPPLYGIASGWLREPLHRVAAAGALLQLGDTRGRPMVLKFLGSRRPEVRGFALQMLARQDRENALELLCTVLRDPDDERAGLAAELLGELRLVDAHEALLQATHRDARAEVRTAARAALAALGHTMEPSTAGDDPDDDEPMSNAGDE